MRRRAAGLVGYTLSRLFPLAVALVIAGTAAAQVGGALRKPERAKPVAPATAPTVAGAATARIADLRETRSRSFEEEETSGFFGREVEPTFLRNSQNATCTRTRPTSAWSRPAPPESLTYRRSPRR